MQVCNFKVTIIEKAVEVIVYVDYITILARRRSIEGGFQKLGFENKLEQNKIY